MEALRSVFSDPGIQVAFFIKWMRDLDAVSNPNIVKTVCDNKNSALYFTRSPVPSNRSEAKTIYHEHIGIYAYRKEALLAYTKWPAATLEQVEMLEQLRYLENGVKYKWEKRILR